MVKNRNDISHFHPFNFREYYMHKIAEDLPFAAKNSTVKARCSLPAVTLYLFNKHSKTFLTLLVKS